MIRALIDMPEVARVTYLRLEIVGPRMLYVIGDVDLVGDDTESHVAVRLRALEARISGSPMVADAVSKTSSTGTLRASSAAMRRAATAPTRPKSWQGPQRVLNSASAQESLSAQ
jgi:hypothetical protein